MVSSTFPLLKTMNPTHVFHILKTLLLLSHPSGITEPSLPHSAKFSALEKCLCLPILHPDWPSGQSSSFSFQSAAGGSFPFFPTHRQIMGFYITNKIKSKCLRAATSLLIIKYFKWWHDLKHIHWLFANLDNN